MKPLCRAFLAACLAAMLPAQGIPGWWMFSTDYHQTVVGPGPMWLGNFSGGYSEQVAADDGAFFQWGFPLFSSGVGIYQATRVSGPTSWQYQFLAPLATAARITVDRKRVWMLGADGDLKYVLKGISNQTPTTVVNVATLGIIAPPLFMPMLQCTNGRELFVSIADTGVQPAHIFAIDVEANPIRVRPLVQWQGGGLLNRMPTPIRLGRNGKLLVIDHPVTFELDPASGTLTALPLQPPLYQNGIGPGGQPIFDYDSWEDRICAGKDGSWAYAYTNLLNNGPGWSLVFTLWSEVLFGVTSLAPRPFELLGIGCPNGTGRDPRIGWQGLPRPGQSYSLTLRDAEPYGFAFFWLGLSDTYWAPLGTLPFDAAPFGAPGCRVRVAADVPFPVPVDGSGRANLSQAVPSNPAFVGLELFAQTASSTTANAFGFAASDAVVIRVR